MMRRNGWFAGSLLAGVLLFGMSEAVVAQSVPPPDAYGPGWSAPRGYDDFYHENGEVNMAARQGYSAGFAQGESDFQHGHSYRPMHVNTFKHVPDSPQGINRNEFKRIYREAFERGYAKGFGR